MAEFTEILKIRKRMCESCESCNDCPLYQNKQNVVCDLLLKKYPEEFERICLEWAKENPEITNRDKLYQIIKEAFGEEIANAIITRPNVCDCCLLNDDKNKSCGYISCNDCSAKVFWNKPYVEPKGDE